MCTYNTLHFEVNLRYTWDNIKNDRNFKKHGIWFEEAQTVFADKNALEMFDEDNSEEEERFIFIGLSSLPRLLVVVFCERVGEEVRIISARKATKAESREYEKRV